MDRVYDDTCELTCTDNGNIVQAEIMQFVPEKFLKVSINRSVGINLAYNSQHKEYVGSMAGLEFTTAGPNGRDVNKTRHF
jgi:hypothetical protein